MTTTSKEEKPKREDQGLFLQLPYILIDTLHMSDSASLGFIRFCRQCLQKDKTITYSGSYRQLAAYIQQSRMTCYRSVEQWVNAGLVTKMETPDDFILTGNLSDLWSKNLEHCKTHQRPKLGQSATSTASQIGTSKAQQRPSLTSTASQDNLSSVPNLDANEHEKGDIYTLGDTCKDTFFSEGENVSCSQTLSQTTEEKKEGPSMSDWLAELDAKMDALDQQYQVDSSRLQENKAHQSTQAPLFQDTVPAEKVAAPKVVLPDMTKDLNQRDNRQPTAKEQARIDEREQREKEQRIKRREREIGDLFDRLFAFPVDRGGYNKPHLHSLAGNVKATDELIELAFKQVRDDPRTKNNPKRLTITTICDELPAIALAHSQKRTMQVITPDGRITEKTVEAKSKYAYADEYDEIMKVYGG